MYSPGAHQVAPSSALPYAYSVHISAALIVYQTLEFEVFQFWNSQWVIRGPPANYFLSNIRSMPNFSNTYLISVTK